jgi:ubiquitin-like protein Nedd8
MLLYLWGITNKISRIEIAPTDRVKVLKSKIQAKHGIHSSRQRLIFHGRQLDDEETLESYSVTDESTIQVCGYLFSASGDSRECASQAESLSHSCKPS